MYLYHYGIGGLVLRLEAPFALREDPNSRLFRRGDSREEAKETRRGREEARRDIGVVIELVDNLPRPGGILLGQGPFTRLYRGQDQTRLSLVTLNRWTGEACLRADYPVLGGEIRLMTEAGMVEYASLIRNIWPAMDLPYQLLLQGVVVLHASAVAFQGGVVAFVGPSGVGKSTQAALWEKLRGAWPLNGDKVALSCREGQALAWGLPFCGTSGICQDYRLPLRALVLLSQGQDNRAEPVQGAEALSGLLNNTFGHNKVEDCHQRLMEGLLPLMQRIPVIRLSCRPEEGAVRCLERTMEDCGR